MNPSLRQAMQSMNETLKTEVNDDALSGRPVPMEKRMQRATIHAYRALRKRHWLEEGAHGPAVAALSNILSSQGVELSGKLDELQQELSHSYRMQANVSEQLVTQITSCQNLTDQLAEKENLINKLQEELSSLRTKLQFLEGEKENQGRALDVLVFETTSLRLCLQELEAKLSKAEQDNKMLVDRWMEQKMVDAEKLNEANAMYEDMMDRLKASRLEELARRQVDGIVRHSEAGAELYVSTGMPTQVRHTVQAHDNGGLSIAFEHSGGAFYSGGNDCTVRSWDTVSCSPLSTLRGSVGSVMDLALSVDSKLVLGACSDHKLYLWDSSSGRIKHTLTGHAEKVCSVDLSHSGNKRAVSAASDRTIKLWDLVSGYGVTTIVCYSNCNSICITSDASVICSGHFDGNLRFWDNRTGKLSNEVAAHGQGITSVSLSKSGNTVLTTGRDNVNNIFDVRTLEIRATYRSPSYRVATNWSRTCLSPDEKYVAGGSLDGSVIVWSCRATEGEKILKGGHNQPVLACAWSNTGKPLATLDKSGRICIWE